MKKEPEKNFFPEVDQHWFQVDKSTGMSKWSMAIQYALCYIVLLNIVKHTN